MASVFTHPVVALSLRWAAGRRAVPWRLLLLGSLCTLLPDLDSIGFWLGIPYEHWLGHRGLTHSLPTALFLGVLATRWTRPLGGIRRTVFATVFLCTASHGVLDALTGGGLGVAFFSPFSNERFFFPWRPIVVSPISVVGFFEQRSWAVLGSEVLWVWGPLMALSAPFAYWRSKDSETRPVAVGARAAALKKQGLEHRMLNRESEKRALIKALAASGVVLALHCGDLEDEDLPSCLEITGPGVAIVKLPFNYDRLQETWYCGNWNLIAPPSPDFRSLDTFRMSDEDVEQAMKEKGLVLLIDSFHDDTEWRVFRLLVGSDSTGTVEVEESL